MTEKQNALLNGFYAALPEEQRKVYKELAGCPLELGLEIPDIAEEDLEEIKKFAKGRERILDEV